MTLLGKILVCVNLVISLTMAALALGIYTQRINWTNQPAQATPDKAAGELAVRIEQIKEKWNALQAAEARQQTALTALLQAEQQRPADQKWYDEQLRLMVHAAADQPVRVMALRDGRPEPDPANFNRPKMEAGRDRSKQPLRSLDSYSKDIRDAHEQIAVERDRFSKLTEEDAALTQKAIGPKGLRQRIDDEEDKRQRVGLEINDFVQPQLVNVRVESDLLLKRRDQLRRRIDELKKAPVAGE